MTDSAAPPVAAVRPESFTFHGITVTDNYRWLKDQDYPQVDDPDVLAYLAAENSYFETQMAPVQADIETLFQEIKARQPAEDSSVPYLYRNYWYQWRYAKGAQYRAWYRAPQDQPEDWSILLDEPALAEGHDYFRLGGLSVSPDGTRLAYSTDTDGSERFTLFVQDIVSGELLNTPIPGTIGEPVWAADSKTMFYLLVNEQWRPHQVHRYEVGGGGPGPDTLVYQEQDDAFFVGLELTQSEQYILITPGDHVTNETYLLPADQPTAEPRLIEPRRSGHEYDVDHQGDELVIRTNRNHKNFELVRAPLANPGEANWRTIIAASDREYLMGHFCLAQHVLVAERLDGLDQIRVLDEQGQSHRVAFPEASYDAGFGITAAYNTTTVRLAYTSMVTPNTVYDYNINDRKLDVLKVQQIPSGYDASQYATQRLNVPARDGASVPVSIVYKKGFQADGSAPLYLYGYGAYGHAVSPTFSTTRLSLLDRGFAVAIAHIRGGDDLGYHWYEQGKLDKRTNTFNDFVDVARFLIDQKFTSAGRIAIAGGSAGGELMGAVVNQAPELWGAVAAHVPFVDVLNTMLDTSLPLTPIEWPEGGNPIEDKTAFEYIRSYSPYDQLQPGSYPPILVTAGLNDPRVTYWEPAKYVAKLRTLKTDTNLLLLKTNMGAGHGGKSGRFDSLREVAEEYVFMLTSLGLPLSGSAPAS